MWVRTRPAWPTRPTRLLLSLVVHLHQITVCHPADGVVRSGDHFVAAFQAAEHFEILVARDPHLDRDEFGLARAHDEHPFGLLARLARFQLRGDGDWFWRLAALVSLGLFHHLAIRVVDELPYRDRGNRHRRHLFARGRRDVGGAREPWPDARHRFVEDHDDFEVGRLRAGGWRGRL